MIGGSFGAVLGFCEKEFVSRLELTPQMYVTEIKRRIGIWTGVIIIFRCFSPKGIIRSDFPLDLLSPVIFFVFMN